MAALSSPCPAGDWDSLPLGYSFMTAGRSITEADVVNFACLSGDFNRLHVDAEFARTTHFGQRIAHGLLVLSVLSGLTTQSQGYRNIEPYILALIDLQCRFPKPTLLGDTIVVRITVADKRESSKPGRGEMTFRREAINQRGETVAQADFKMLLRRAETIQ